MEETVLNHPPSPVTTIMEETRHDVDEIDRSFEIINKADVELLKTTDALNNKNETVIETSKSPATTQLTDLDATNNNTIVVNKAVAGLPSKSDTSDIQRKYSREDLLSLKKTALDFTPQISVDAIFKPHNPQLDVVLTANLQMRIPQRQNSNPRDAASNLFPNFASMPGRPFNKQNSYKGGRGSQQGPGSRNHSQNQIVVELDKEVKLKEAQNPWCPTHLQKKAELTEEQLKSAEVLKTFRSILNKLTPDNYTRLVEEHVKKLDLESPERQEKCIELVFEKAIAEPKFATGYASLCKAISFNNTKNEVSVAFKKQLITRCQKEFEKHRDDPAFKNTAERVKEIESQEDQAKKDELKNLYDEESSNLRRRAAGTVQFIGELYKIDMLTVKIMVSCIQMLLNPDLISEETLESLCKLLTTIGKKLEKLDEKKVDLSETFKQLNNIVNKKSLKISSRVRFMIQDVIDLRKNNWTPRRVENKPKTIEQIQKETVFEQYTNQMLNQQMSNRKISKGQRDGGFQNNNSGGQKRSTGQGPGEDGWSVSYGKNNRPINFDMKKVNITSSTDSPKLGAATLFQNFGSGYAILGNESGDGKNSSRESLTDITTTDQRNNKMYGGRFSGGGQNMSNQYQNQNRNYNRQGSQGDRQGGGRGRASRSLHSPTANYNNKQPQFAGSSSSRQNNNRQNPYQQHGPPHHHQQQQQQQHNPQQFRSDLPMKSATLPRKLSGNDQPQQPPMSVQMPIRQKVKEQDLIADPEKVQNGIMSMVSDYSEEKLTMNQVMDTIHKFKITQSVLLEVYVGCLDRKDKARQCLTEVLTESVNQQIIELTDIKNAIKGVFDLADDLLVDYPFLYQYMAQYIALPLYKGVMKLNDLLTVAETQVTAKNGHTVLKEIFKLVEQKYGQQSLCQICNNVDLKLFLADKDLNEFLKENNWDYIKDTSASKAETSVSSDKIFDHVKGMLKSKAEIDSITAWIKSNTKSYNENDFIRGFSLLVLEHCIEASGGSYKLNESLLETLAPLLKEFIAGNDNTELQCLYLIQKLIVKLEFPQNMLNSIFSRLYDEEVLQKESFEKWRTSEDPMEQEGKGVVLKSCNQFFTLMNQEDQNESSGEEN